MSDDNDNNDRLMEQFIEKATPKLLEALISHVTEHVEQQISGLKTASEKMLDEIKDHKRVVAEKTASEKADTDQFKRLLETGDAPKTIHEALQGESIKLTREQARDTVLYRKAKADAAKSGTTVQIVAD